MLFIAILTYRNTCICSFAAIIQKRTTMYSGLGRAGHTEPNSSPYLAAVIFVSRHIKSTTSTSKKCHLATCKTTGKKYHQVVPRRQVKSTTVDVVLSALLRTGSRQSPCFCHSLCNCFRLAPEPERQGVGVIRSVCAL